MNEEMRIRIGQRLSVGFDGFTIPQEYVDLVKRYKVGNVILFRELTAGSSDIMFPIEKFYNL